MGFERPAVFVWQTLPLVGVVYLATLCSVGALGLQVFAQRFTSSARASLLYLTEPIFAALMAWLFAGLGMSVWEMVGAGAILLSLVVGNAPDTTARDATSSKATTRDATSR
jgi:drug/metabolite transporter (DMT)-like permease